MWNRKQIVHRSKAVSVLSGVTNFLGPLRLPPPWVGSVVECIKSYPSVLSPCKSSLVYATVCWIPKNLGVLPLMMRCSWRHKGRPLPVWSTCWTGPLMDNVWRAYSRDAPGKFGPLRSAVQGHSRSSNLTRIDQIPMTIKTSYYWSTLTVDFLYIFRTAATAVETTFRCSQHRACVHWNNYIHTDK